MESSVQRTCHRTPTIKPSRPWADGEDGLRHSSSLFWKILREESLSVWGDGSNVRDYLYIDDFIELCVEAIRNPMSIGVRIFNASSGTGTSLNELFHAIEAVTQKALLRSYFPSRTLDAQYIVMDSNATQLHYGWTPKTSLHEGLRETWDWFNTIQH